MSARRSALAGLLLAVAACAGAGDGEAPAGKRVAAPAVVPQTLHGVRYEAPSGTRDADGQLGGYVVARDARSGRELWRLRVYATTYDPQLEPDVQDVFIESLRIGRGGRTLEITDERGRRYTLDPVTRSVRMH